MISQEKHEIGKSCEGGILIYIMQPGDPGFVEGEYHGIVVSPFDVSKSIRWGCPNILVSATNMSIFTGIENTKLITEKCSYEKNAASICYHLELNGFNDWYLPSYEELSLIYENREKIYGLDEAYYWSSSESDKDNSWVFNFNMGIAFEYAKDLNVAVRAIRKF